MSAKQTAEYVAPLLDPATPVKVMEGLQTWLAQQGCKSINEVIGTVKLPGDK